MKHSLVISIILLISILSSAKTIRVAILDTGINKHLNLPICPTDNKTFVGDDIDDVHGHGTVMANIIKDQAKEVKFCFIVVKFYQSFGWKNPLNFKLGLKHISTLKVDFVNISGGGQDFDKEEKGYVEIILKTGARIIAAAGNERMNLDKGCNFFPACYFTEIIVVGGKNLETSNYGKVVDVYAPGSAILPFGRKMYGTSVSAAYVTGNLVRVLGRMK